MIKVLFQVCLFIMLITFVTGSIGYRRLNTAVRWVFYVIAFSLITELSGNIVQSVTGTNQLLFALANPIETALLVMFFLAIIRKKIVRIFSMLAIIYISIATIVNSFFLTQNPVPYLFFIILKGIIITVLSIVYFYNLLLTDKKLERPDISRIILVTGMLFYYSFSSVYYSILNFQMNHHMSLAAILTIRPFLYVIYLIMECSILFIFVRILLEKKVPDYAGHTE